ncbi:RecB family exonuclease [Gordonia sp. CPCC 205333]|uniref:RecB family exonuclease n=1 Tax=Gordonia sp. CPCC 205333 TaxID=3140790 RepID=UPI003AF33D6C
MNIHPGSATAVEPTPVDGRGLAGRPLALSPSRAADFRQCPLLYRYRTIDRFPEQPTQAQTRGHVVHAALENLFDMPAALRTPESAHLLVEGAWAAMCEADPALHDVITVEETATFLAQTQRLITTYYTMENPTAFDAKAVEAHVEIEDGDVLLRGYIDRIDVAPTGEIRVVDYKTGRCPSEAYEAKALFQMKFYALAIFRSQGVVPDRLQLMYLSDGKQLHYHPDRAELERFGRTLKAIWTAITEAVASGDFRPHKTRMCKFCEHKTRCPEFGGTIPPYPGPPEGFSPPRRL